MIRGVFISGWFFYGTKTPTSSMLWEAHSASQQRAARCTLNYYYPATWLRLFFQGFPYRNQGLELTIHVSYQAHACWTPGNFNISSLTKRRSLELQNSGEWTPIKVGIPLIYIPLSTRDLVEPLCLKQSSAKWLHFRFEHDPQNSIRWKPPANHFRWRSGLWKKTGRKVMLLLMAEILHQLID